VILAGGRGTRLGRLTDNLPKPMIPINGKPFLHYIIENLKEQGIENVLLLLGYMPGAIQDYFGDGGEYGLKIEYSVTDVEDETGFRIKKSEDKLHPHFLLLYCDNYWPLRLEEMWENFKRTKADVQITVYSNDDKYTKDNVRLGREGMVTLYDKSRSAENLKGVEIGYAIVKRDSVMDILPEGNVSFESTVFPGLASRGKLFAYVTGHRYYSIGSPGRLPATSAFLSRHLAVILDRDGVLNEKPPKAEYVLDFSQFKWLAGAREAVRLLNEKGYMVIVVTNQAGVARGKITEEALEEIHHKMKTDLDETGASVEAVYYCPHGWDEGCECRKPKPGMLFAAQRDHYLDLTRTIFIGDDIRDRQAGQAAGCRTLLVTKSEPLIDLVRKIIPAPGVCQV